MNKVHYYHIVGGHNLPKGVHIEVREGMDTVCGQPSPNWTAWVVSTRRNNKFEHKLQGLWGHSFTPDDVLEEAGPRLGEVGLNLVIKTKWKFRK